MNQTADGSARRSFCLAACLLAVPLMLVLAKQPAVPTADFLMQHASFVDLPVRLQTKLSHILFVPLGAMLVVLVRLTFGLRVLGPFRSILLAVAFQITGVVMGIVFLVGTTAVMVGLRPSIRSLRLSYFGRITVMLSTVAALMVLGVMSSEWLHMDLLRTIVYLPIVVLCLVGDAFARTMNQEGIRSALWRGGMTVLIAVLLAGLAGIPDLNGLLVRYPELLIAQIGGIVIISRFLNWRLLERFNPKVGEDEDDEDDREDALLSRRRAGVAKALARTTGVPVTPLQSELTGSALHPAGEHHITA